MTTFEDGPAKNAVLHLHRVPMMLRVVVDRAGVVDALDQLDDVAKPDETIFVYMMLGTPGLFRACKRGKPSVFGISARYRLLPGQPCDDRIRQSEDWAKWCDSHKDILIKEKNEWDSAFVKGE